MSLSKSDFSQSRASCALGESCSNGEFVFTVKWAGEERLFYVCQHSLARISDLFCRMIQADNKTSASADTYLTVENTSPEEFLEFLRIVVGVRGSEINDTNLPSLARLADKYETDLFFDRYIHFVEKRLSDFLENNAGDHLADEGFNVFEYVDVFVRYNQAIKVPWGRVAYEKCVGLMACSATVVLKEKVRLFPSLVNAVLDINTVKLEKSAPIILNCGSSCKGFLYGVHGDVIGYLKLNGEAPIKVRWRCKPENLNDEFCRVCWNGKFKEWLFPPGPEGNN